MIGGIMRPIFVIVTFIIFSLLFFSACSDTTERRGRFSPEERTAQLTGDLDLSDGQAKQIKEILTEQQEKFSQMREEFSGDRSEMMMAMREMREEFDEKIKEILDEEQKEKYDQIQAERPERGRRYREREQ
jgi:Spy/CpxP family protein refolding chaperone